MRRFTCSLALTAAAAVSEWSCHTTRAASPAPPLPVPTVSTTPDRAPQPSASDAPPPAQSSPPIQTTPAVTEPAPESAPSSPALVQPPPQQPTQPHPARPAGTVPGPQAQPTPGPPAAPTPQLAPVLTPDQQRQLGADIDQSLEHAQASLRSIGNRQLTQQQHADMDDIRNFIRQAQATRSTDLPAAKRLAERAEVLARNLEKSLR
jgi:hypothetical protein